MGLLNDVYPIFFYLKLRKSATGRAFDGVVTPSANCTDTDSRNSAAPCQNLACFAPDFGQHFARSLSAIPYGIAPLHALI